jgi:membrane protease YdiL (CAAX protease family)
VRLPSRDPALHSDPDASLPPHEPGTASRPSGENGPPSLPSPAFSLWSTALYGIASALLILQGWGALATGDPGAWLARPGASAARISNRDIALSGAAEATSGLRGQLRLFRSGSQADTLAFAIALHGEVLDGLEDLDAAGAGIPDASDQVRAALSILAAEGGDPRSALELAEQISDGGAFAASLSTAYAPALSPPDGDWAPPLSGVGHEAPPLAAFSQATFAQAGLEEWMLARPSIRLLAQSAEGRPIAKGLAADLALRGEKLQVRLEALRLLQGAVVALGLGIVLTAAWRSRRAGPVPSSERSLSPPWLLADGIGVLVRAEFWGRLYYYVLAHSDTLGLPAALAGPLYDWGGLISALPLLWLVHRHLLSPRSGRATQPDPLGLFPRPSSIATLLGVALAALAVDLFVSEALGWSFWLLGIGGHWAEGFDESLVFESAGQAWLAASSYLVWAPAFEELSFRGLLYFSLRRRFAPLPSALLSAAIFGGVHFYSLPGLVITFWHGIVWAWAFERTRSLWPSIAAHALYNATFVAWMLLIYR